MACKPELAGLKNIGEGTVEILSKCVAKKCDKLALYNQTVKSSDYAEGSAQCFGCTLNGDLKLLTPEFQKECPRLNPNPWLKPADWPETVIQVSGMMDDVSKPLLDLNLPCITKDGSFCNNAYLSRKEIKGMSGEHPITMRCKHNPTSLITKSCHCKGTLFNKNRGCGV